MLAPTAIIPNAGGPFPVCFPAVSSGAGLTPMNIRRSTDRIGSIGFGVEFGRYLLGLMRGDFDEAEECSHAAPRPCEVELLLEVGGTGRIGGQQPNMVRGGHRAAGHDTTGFQRQAAFDGNLSAER
ncbi:hypothetical protein ACQP0C_17630 [Nocardia sp. CA-129566]|uniref:hypothetical protein n=1 Tax=Nocardia sp. CA-129566 TaxID=3239976 RepID=UPI003D96C638